MWVESEGLPVAQKAGTEDPPQSIRSDLRLVAWESTRACQLACLHCRAKAQPGPHPDQLRKEEVLGLIDEIASFSRPIFIITGGNPLLRGDIFEISAYAAKMGLRPVMSPSGSHITREIVREMVSSGIRRISMSLDGSTANIHDFFRQVPGCFDETLEALRYAREEGLPFQINTTVTCHNLFDLPAIRDLVLASGAAAWDVFMFIPTGRGGSELAVSPRAYEETMAFVYECSQSSPNPVKMTCAPQYRRLLCQRKARVGGMQSAGRGCMSGNGFCFVSHVGEVLGCGMLPLSAGNVRERPLGEIYRDSVLFRSFRDPNSLHGKCRRCEFRAVCGGCRARAWAVSKDPLGEEPYCWYEPGKGL